MYIALFSTWWSGDDPRPIGCARLAGGRRDRHSPSRAIARASIPSAISRPTSGSCKPTLMLGSTRSTSRAPARADHRGRVLEPRSRKFFILADVTSKARSRKPIIVAPLALEQSVGSMRSSRRSVRSTVCFQTFGETSAGAASRQSSKIWSAGCAPSDARCPAIPMSPRPWTTC